MCNCAVAWVRLKQGHYTEKLVLWAGILRHITGGKESS